MSNLTYEKIKSEAIQFLKDNFIMEIATSHDNNPSVSVVVYMIDENLNFYFITQRNSYKAKYIINNPRISLVVWEHLKMSVQADGVVSIVEDVVKKDWVLNAFADATTKEKNFWSPLLRIKNGEYIIFKISPTWMRILDLSTTTIRQDLSPFTEINLSDITPKNTSTKKIRFLIMDNDPILLKIIKYKFLKEKGWESIITTSYKEANEIFDREKPDCVLTEIIIDDNSGKTGFDFIKDIKSKDNGSNTQVFIFSELSQKDDMDIGAKLGVIRYFVKSKLTLNEVINEISQILFISQNSK